MTFTIKFLIILSVSLLFSGVLFFDAQAKQYPGLVVAIESDPYYWAEGGFGWDTVEQYDAPNPYKTGSSDSSAGFAADDSPNRRFNVSSSVSVFIARSVFSECFSKLELLSIFCKSLAASLNVVGVLSFSRILENCAKISIFAKNVSGYHPEILYKPNLVFSL